MAELFPDVPVFAQMKDVSPGMSIRSLTRARHPVVAPYLGFHEAIAGDTVEYMIEDPPQSVAAFSGFVFEIQTKLESQPVVGINSWERSLSSDSVEARWARRVMSLRSRNKREPSCFTTTRSGLSKIALARNGDIWVGVQLISVRMLREVSRSWNSPHVLMAFATTDLDRYVPRKFTKKGVRCPTSDKPPPAPPDTMSSPTWKTVRTDSRPDP